MFARRLAAAIVVAALASSAPASAHEAAKSSIVLEVGEEAVTGRMELPLSILNVALQVDVGLPGDILLDVHREEVETYLADHTVVTGDDGAPWALAFTSMTTRSRDDAEYLDAGFTATPHKSPLSGFTLRHDALLELFSSHEIIVSSGPTGEEQRVVAVLTGGKTTVDLDERGRASAGFSTMVHHGFDHVGDGADHLLFLLVLLLPAPLMASAGRWQPGASGWRTLRQVVHVVTAFTLGHSITLVASALDWVDVASRPVEILIAISVGAGALHAVRPLIGHREAVIAGAFGLVHGLAFAGILDDLGLGGNTALTSLLGFNIGVELAQLAAVALVFPSLYAMSRTAWYPSVRKGGAGIALVAAAAWVADRAGWATNPLAEIEQAAVDNPFVIAGGLAVVAALAVLYERRGTLRSRMATELTLQTDEI